MPTQGTPMTRQIPGKRRRILIHLDNGASDERTLWARCGNIQSGPELNAYLTVLKEDGFIERTPDHKWAITDAGRKAVDA